MRLEIDALSARHPAARAEAPAALQGLSLSVEPGEQVAVIGPSGAGKTTLLHALAMVLRPDRGHVMLDGIDPWSVGGGQRQQLRRRMFLAPHVPPLPPRQRVITAVQAARLPAMSLAASLRSLFYPSDIPAAFDALSRFDLGDKLFERVDRLSGGERQRVGLARALLAPASLWLIDEPLSALDPVRAQQAIATLVRGAAERRVTLVATLHQVDAALAHFPRIVGLREGAALFDLPAAAVGPALLQQLYAQHEDELTGPAPESPEPAARPAPPAVMHCR